MKELEQIRYRPVLAEMALKNTQQIKLIYQKVSSHSQQNPINEVKTTTTNGLR